MGEWQLGSSKAAQITQAGNTTISPYEIQGMHPLASASLPMQNTAGEQLSLANRELHGQECSICQEALLQLTVHVEAEGIVVRVSKTYSRL